MRNGLSLSLSSFESTLFIIGSIISPVVLKVICVKFLFRVTWQPNVNVPLLKRR